MKSRHEFILRLYLQDTEAIPSLGTPYVCMQIYAPLARRGALCSYHVDTYWAQTAQYEKCFGTGPSRMYCLRHYIRVVCSNPSSSEWSEQAARIVTESK